MDREMVDRSDGPAVRIGIPTRQDTEDGATVRFPVHGLDPKELWFRVSSPGVPFLDDSLDAAVVTLLIPAMDRSLPLVVDGPMSRRLAWNLRNTVIPVSMRLVPQLKPILVHCAELRTGYAESGRAIGTGLSRGVDSLSACQDHYLNPDLQPEERVTHLVFMHIGHHGYGSDLEDRVAERWDQAQAAAADLGLPLIRVDSNAPAFYPPEHDSPLNWAKTLTVRNASVPLLLQKGMRRFLLASSFSWEYIEVGPSRHMTIADPILCPALGSENLEFAVVGSEFTRVEKTRRIARMDLARRHLDVCTMEAGVNCSRCSKCVRTALTLELHGQLDAFGDRFDLDVYRRHRAMFIARILAGPEFRYLLEIKNLMDEVGFRPPLKARILAALIRLWRILPLGLRRRLRRSGS